jgi:IS5 family transposase
MQGKNTEKPVKSTRKRAVTSKYISPNQLTIPGFETPFEQQLTKNNRWVRLGELIPWDEVVGQYDKLFQSEEGKPPINGRVVLGAVIIKHMLNLTDRETINQIQENMFMQHFIGYSSFNNDEPFSHTLFPTIRERLDLDLMDRINQLIMEHSADLISKKVKKNIEETDANNDEKPTIENQGKLLLDATVAPQNITYPTDLKLLNAARVKSEEIIDKLYAESDLEEKPRTYRKVARKEFLNAIKKKKKSYKEIHKANKTQLQFLARNIGYFNLFQNHFKGKLPLKQKDIEYIETIELVYAQQITMNKNRTRTIENRIVNLHQPHVRPIVRGKDGKKVEFGSKLQFSLVNGFTRLDKLSWDNFNEGKYLKISVEDYKIRFGFYPKEVLVDKIYWTRENRDYLKLLNIKISAKPLGRPSKESALSNQVSPGERNPIEGKFGQAKVAYGMNNIRAKLKTTSESWIASITLVLNLVNLTRLAQLCLDKFIQWLNSLKYIFNQPKFALSL